MSRRDDNIGCAAQIVFAIAVCSLAIVANHAAFIDSAAPLPPNTVTCESTCADGRAILHYQCAAGPVLCECICPAKADADGDGDVDLADYGWFQRRFGAK